MQHFEKNSPRVYLGLLACAFLGVATSGMYLVDHVNRDQEYFEIYNEEGMGFGYISGAEYLIEGTDEKKLTFERAQAGAGVEISNYGKKYLTTEFDCVNEGDESFVELPVLLYKGYRAADGATGRRMEIFAGDNQKLCVRIPALYRGSVKVKYVSPIYWRAAEVVSLAAAVWAACAVFVVWRRKVRK